MSSSHASGVPFTSNYLPLLLARAAAVVSGSGDPLQRFNSTAPVGRVLAALSDFPNASVGDLAETCYMQQPTMTKLLAGMERKGLVRRHQDSRDRRVVRIALTPRGRTVAATLLRAAKEYEAALLARYPRAEEIKDTLRDLIAESARHPRPHG